MSRLKEKYVKEAVPALTREFGYTNVMAVPRVQKVVVNICPDRGVEWVGSHEKLKAAPGHRLRQSPHSLGFVAGDEARGAEIGPERPRRVQADARAEARPVR